MAQVKLRNEFARFFIITMILFGLASLVQKLISANLPPTQQMLFSWGFLALTFAPIAWFTYRQRLPLSQFGLTLTGWRRALPESFGLAAGIFSILLITRLVSRQSGDQFSHGDRCALTRTPKRCFSGSPTLCTVSSKNS